ncbi:MAG TPA: hypothetical protein VKY57_10440 [Chitinispirillaceae bacterium]|jgi:hypothetical protein|nr:hypothetical protein [Chitinispirillaceae bacterium]
MEKKDLFLLLLGFCGWGWGVIQFIINRRNQKRDKLSDRRYEAYSAYMKKYDELMNGVRTDPNMIFGFTSEFVQTALTGDPEQVNNALVKMNEKIIDFVRKASEPLMILNQELNALLIVCSDNLIGKLEELKQLTTDFNNEMRNALQLASPIDPNSIAQQFSDLGHNIRWQRFNSLNDEIIHQMRQELGIK